MSHVSASLSWRRSRYPLLCSSYIFLALYVCNELCPAHSIMKLFYSCLYTHVAIWISPCSDFQLLNHVFDLIDHGSATINFMTNKYISGITTHSPSFDVKLVKSEQPNSYLISHWVTYRVIDYGVACTLTKNQAIITLRYKGVTLPTLLNNKNKYLMGNNI